MMLMPEFKLDFQTALLALAVILLIAQTISTIAKGRRDLADLTGRTARDAEAQAIRQRITDLEAWKIHVESRLQQGNVRFDENARDTTEILIVLRSMIKHMQSGNDHAKLQETDDKLYKYLVEKRGVNPSIL